MYKYIIILLVLICLFVPNKVGAIYDPLAYPNNKYGIHIIDENDLYSAASLVNSSGGDWGYVTLVITQSDRDLNKWQSIFDKMRQLHLIPLIRLATKMEANFWLKPDLSDASNWSDFLNQLNWPVKNRYVILFNEPNHAKEWGGEVNPSEYADIVVSYSTSLKKRSDDFFVLPAGLDASAPNGYDTMDEVVFLQTILKVQPKYMDFIDGWVSHSYPNPGFKGNVKLDGRGTLATYKWEMDLLKKSDISKEFPIFITETGWPHQEGTYINYEYINSDKIADYIKEAAIDLWVDNRIVAITPFILSYLSFPFEHFSWQKRESNQFYQHYYAYKNISKVAGDPQHVVPAFDFEKSVLGLQSSLLDIVALKRYPSDNRAVFRLVDNAVNIFPFLSRFISDNI